MLLFSVGATIHGIRLCFFCKANSFKIKSLCSTFVQCMNTGGITNNSQQVILSSRQHYIKILMGSCKIIWTKSVSWVFIFNFLKSLSLCRHYIDAGLPLSKIVVRRKLVTIFVSNITFFNWRSQNSSHQTHSFHTK